MRNADLTTELQLTGKSIETDFEKKKNISSSAVRAGRSTFKEILFVWNYTEWGGAQIYFLGVMRLALKKFKVQAVMPAGTSDKLLGYFKQENIPTQFFEARVDGSKAENGWHKLRRRLNDLRCHWVVARHLSQQGLKDKIVQIEAGPWNAASLLFYLALKTHVFVTLHISQDATPTLRNRWIKLKYKLLCALPKFHLLASNEDMKESLRWFVPEKFWQSIPIAYTGVNTKEIQTVLSLPLNGEELLDRYNLPKERLLIFSLGSIVERKGFRVFLETVKILKDTDPELFFVWIGDGDALGEMQSLIAEWKLENFVRIIRPVEIGENRQDLLQLLRLADIYVHPSFAEGLPGAMLEAMALKKPVIASRVNAIPEAVKEGQTGMLIEAGDGRGFAAAIVQLAGDADLRSNLAQNGQTKVLSNFTEERCAEVTVEFYEQCLGIKDLEKEGI